MKVSQQFATCCSEFHGKIYVKNRYRMNHKAMSAISLFRVKFTLEFTSLAMNFCWTARVLKEYKHTLSLFMEKEKSHFRINCQYPTNRNHAKIRNHKKTLSVQGQKESFTDGLYSTLSLKTRSFTFWFTSLKHASLAWNKNSKLWTYWLIVVAADTFIQKLWQVGMFRNHGSYWF